MTSDPAVRSVCAHHARSRRSGAPRSPAPPRPATRRRTVSGTVSSGKGGARRARRRHVDLAPEVGSAAQRTRVTIACQVTGERVKGRVRTTDKWDRLTNGQYVSDAFIKRDTRSPSRSARRRRPRRRRPAGATSLAPTGCRRPTGTGSSRCRADGIGGFRTVARPEHDGVDLLARPEHADPSPSRPAPSSRSLQRLRPDLRRRRLARPPAAAAGTSRCATPATSSPGTATWSASPRSSIGDRSRPARSSATWARPATPPARTCTSRCTSATRPAANAVDPITFMAAAGAPVA